MLILKSRVLTLSLNAGVKFGPLSVPRGRGLTCVGRGGTCTQLPHGDAPQKDQTRNEHSNSSDLRYLSMGGDPTCQKIGIVASGGRGRGKILMFELVSYTQASWFLYHKFQVIGVSLGRGVADGTRLFF